MSDTPTQNPHLIQTNPVENTTVQFFKDSVQVGCFDFGVSPVTFTGDVDESARIFVDYVISKVQTELTAARQELKAVTEQRDRLAEACKLLMAIVGEPNSSVDSCWASEDEMDAAWNMGNEALAAVKGGADES